MGYSTEQKNGFFLIRNAGGKELGMSVLRLKEADGYAFKDLSGAPELLPYEDWWLPCETRAKDLAGRLSLEQIAGLMLWSPHQLVPFVPGMPFKGHYGGGDFIPGTTDPAALTDEQKKFVAEEHLRNFLLVTTESAETAASEQQRGGRLFHPGSISCGSRCRGGVCGESPVRLLYPGGPGPGRQRLSAHYPAVPALPGRSSPAPFPGKG